MQDIDLQWDLLASMKTRSNGCTAPGDHLSSPCCLPFVRRVDSRKRRIPSNQRDDDLVVELEVDSSSGYRVDETRQKI